jgi:PKD repeat protein
MNKMKLKIVLNRGVYLMFALATLCSLNSCQPDAVGVGNGLTDANVDASFTVTPVEGASNKFTLSAQKANVIASKWDIGEGTFSGKMIETVFFPDAGTYTVTHTAIGKGGAMNATTKDIVVATSDPVAGNIIQGGKFQSATDHDKWTILKISDSGTSWSFNEGSATVKGGGWNQQGIYQAVQVQANKDYKIDMKVFGSGAINTWFEVYVSKTPPVQNTDYSADGRRMGLSTWDGCATAAFSGKLSTVGCVGSGNTVRFTETGTVYLLIKCGGENIGTTGISITNVEMRGSN